MDPLRSNGSDVLGLDTAVYARTKLVAMAAMYIPVISNAFLLIILIICTTYLCWKGAIVPSSLALFSHGG